MASMSRHKGRDVPSLSNKLVDQERMRHSWRSGSAGVTAHCSEFPSRRRQCYK